METCAQNKNSKKKLLKYSNHLYINEKTKSFGFPLINKLPNIPDNNNIEKFIKEHIIDMDKKDLIQKIYNGNLPEIIIDYSKNNYGDVVINLQYNETLSKERKFKEKNANPYSNNILVFYIDAVSRVIQ